MLIKRKHINKIKSYKINLGKKPYNYLEKAYIEIVDTKVG
jgi:hypothetical protein